MSIAPVLDNMQQQQHGLDAIIINLCEKTSRTAATPG